VRRGAVIGQIRILLVGLSRLVADMVTSAIERQPDMAALAPVAALGPVASLATLVDDVRRLEPDVVIVGLQPGGELPRACVQALAERPQMRVLGIEDHAASTHLYELQPVRAELGELSLDELVDAIRHAARRTSLLDSGAA
jgi:DNA-binding NarL/FixJ family response regulator